MNQPTPEQLAAYMWSHEKGSDPASLTESVKDDWRCLAKGILDTFWPRWIPTKERLPTMEDANDYGSIYLLDESDFEAVIGHWSNADEWHYWMPITKPQPPTE